jgi:hypothetical protein
MWVAKRQKDHLRVIYHAERFPELYPPYASRARQHGQDAAEAADEQAQALAAAGDPAAARDLLEGLREQLPSWPGLTERLAALETQIAAGQKVGNQLARAEKALENRRPEEGLAALEGIPSTLNSPDADRLEQLRGRLERLLEAMDLSPPAVHLEVGEELAFEKKEDVRVGFEITDEYRVAEVRAWARFRDGGQFEEVPIRSSNGGTRYVMEVPASRHGGKAFDFYVKATDPSEHSTFFGSPQQPREMKRKGRWRP